MSVGGSEGVVIAPIDAADTPAVTAIFNHEVASGTAMWNTRPRTEPEMADWIAERRGGGFPVLVARDAAGAVLGYGTFGPFRPHDGYLHTVEHSLYVVPAAQRRGIGRALLAALEAEARALGKHVIIGGLDADNAASLRLHLAAGFVETARMPEVGRKFDRWLTLVLMQKRLT